MSKPTLFGTSGIRGDAKKLFTNQFSFDMARAFARFLTEAGLSGPVAVGMDPRGSSPRITAAFHQGLGFEDRKILDQGACPIPAINYVLKISPAVGSAEITGSHIAAHLNGIKFFAFDEEILKKYERKIESLYFQLKQKVSFSKKKIDLQEDKTAVESYEEMLVKLAEKLPPWRVVVDPGNGAQSGLFSRALRRLGLVVIAINDQIQGEFMSRDTEKQGSFDQLQKTVVRKKAHLGIGFDSDGDRVILVDEKGAFVTGDYVGALIARETKADKVVTPINTSQVVDYIGKKVIRTKVGSPYVVAAMKREKVAFGFEANGGGISSEIMMSRDGGSTAIKILNLLQKHQLSLSDLVGQLPRFFIYRTKVDCPRELNQVIMEKAKKKYQGKTEDQDGLKIWIGKKSWLLFRPSSNAPEFRVWAEAEEPKKAEQLAQKGLDLVKEAILKNKRSSS